MQPVGRHTSDLAVRIASLCASLSPRCPWVDIVWNGDRGILYTNPDVVVPQPGDLDKGAEWWLEHLYDKYGLQFAQAHNKT